MIRHSINFLLVILILTAVPQAEDKTPYKFIFGGNSYTGPKNMSVTWLAERYDYAIAGLSDWPGLHDSIYDTAKAMGKSFRAGPYASSQEINLYDRFQPGKQYNERLNNLNELWLYIYAKHYLDSIGVSAESLVVHIDDDYVSITNQGDGNRAYSLVGLPHHKKRFSYQYWNNTAADTMFYPAGYCWLANGYNTDARRAIAYAYRRHLIEDSVAYGPGDHHWTAFFMDNQYRGGYAPRLYSYYDINSTSGGPTSGLDWIEQSGIGNDVPSNTTYYDNSTLLIDSTIFAVLDSTCDTHGLERIHGFANVEKFSPAHLGAALRHTSVNLENPIDYAKAWPSGWQQWYAMADTMAAHPERYINWLFMGDFLCSSSPGNWNYDSSRVYMCHYAFFLQVRDTNAICGPARFNDINRWRKIYEVDFGEPDGPAYEISSTGSNYEKIAVMRRDYNNGSVAVLVRTSHGSADWVNDVMAVNMHGMYREVDVNADTSVAADSIFYMKPYSGLVLITADSCGVAPTLPNPATPNSGSAVGLSPTLCVTNSGHGNCEDPVTYQFEIAEDANFANIVRQSGWIGEGAGTTCFTTSAPLSNGYRYHWRCRATNGTTTSRWSTVYNFTTPNTPPPAPSGNSPEDQGVVDRLQPVLAVNNVADPDGTSPVYYFEVSKFSNFASLAAQSGAVSEGAGTTSWQVGTPLENGSAYFWRARAYDQVAYSGWMPTMSFTVDASISNQPPTIPTLYSPPEGATVTFVPISLSWYNSTDYDGDVITYEIQLLDSAGSGVIDEATGLTQGSSATTTYAPLVMLENAVWYSWHVRAFDGIEYSSWMNLARFYFDTLYGVNQPPDAPALVSPQDQDTMVSLQVSLVCQPSFDPESDQLTYEFALYTDAALTNKIDSVSGVTAGGIGENIIWPIAALLSSGSQYFWSSRANDGINNSDWASAYTFWAFDFSVNADQSSPTNLFPIAGQLVTKTKPTLEVTNVVSLLDENLYYFEVSEDPTFISRLYSGPVAEDYSGTTTWEVSVPLNTGQIYYWRSRANNSPYSEVSTFMVEAQVYMAPNPFRPSSGHSQVMVFNMSPEGTLTITTVANEVVRVISGNSTGLVTWDVTNDNGKSLASDVYLCYYKDHEKVGRFKFAVIR
jgi:hypothetical protein